MKIVATIEARMTSNRLPGKVLLPVLDKPILHFLVERLKFVKSIDQIVLATTTNVTDDILVEFARNEGILIYRGSEDDVMSRVIGAGEHGSADVIVEITGDCPIIDPDIIEQTIQVYLNNTGEYASNCLIRSYPDGMDTQVFSLATLKKSGSMTNDSLDREHVSLHIKNHPEIFPHVNLIAPPSTFWPELGLTLDERSDYILLTKIIESLYPHNPLFSCLDVIRFLNQNSELVSINQNVVRKGNT